MNKKLLLTLFLFFVQWFACAQSGLFFGGNLNHYLFTESPQSNYAAKFNLGWDFAPSEDKQLVFFEHGTTNYDITNKLKWDQTSRGAVIGFRVSSTRFHQDFYFQGCTNVGKGERVNIADNVTEKMTIYSKFGGINYGLHYRIKPWLSIFYALGANRYKLQYKWESDTETIKRTTTGYRLNPLSGDIKPSSRSLTLSQGLGISVEVIRFDQLSVEFRSEIRFAWNSMVEVYRSPLYVSQIFNLNQVNASILIHLQTSK